MKALQNETRSGFTLIEVMIAIGIMTVGSLGILAMHQAVSQANRAALEMNTALAITERWIERIERDALSWTDPGPGSGTLPGTDYLSELVPVATSTNWFTPAPTFSGESYGFDHFGADVTGGGAKKYCVNLQMHWLRQGRSARVDIRTFWYREGHMVGTATHPNWVTGGDFQNADCDAADADAWPLGVAPNIDVISASTVVTWQRRDGT